MPQRNPLHRLAGVAPSPLDGVVAMAAGLLSDATGVMGGLRGDDPDDWDPEYIRETLPMLRATFGTYFRGEIRGLENIPEDGPALLVGNHSGGLMIADTFVFACGFYHHFGPERRFHQLAHDVAARSPAGGLIRRYGTLAASHENARKAFALRAPVLVYPGGDYETFRPSWHSDRIELGGRKGFIRLALGEGVPIVPVVAIGGQETALFLTRGQRAARRLGLDRLARINVLPVSLGPPFGFNLLDLPGRFPLPAKITIEVLPALDLHERSGSEPDVEEIYDEVTRTMQESLSELSGERALPLVG
jgi:1-acyl-sn-glycerol-3-phosphate acyltransferase